MTADQISVSVPLYTLQRWTHIFGAAAVQVAAAVGNVAH
jgi:hypothetical protein